MTTTMAPAPMSPRRPHLDNGSFRHQAPPSVVPELSWSMIELLKDDGTVLQPHPTKPRARTFTSNRPVVTKGRMRNSIDNTVYHVKRHAQASQEAQLLSRLYHPSIQLMNVHAAGPYFLVVVAWQETLRERIMRLKYDYTLQGVLTEIALPLVRILKYLHMKHEVCYNILSADSVGFLPGNQLVLTDFSKASRAIKDVDDDTGYCHYESFDVWCWGKLIQDILFELRLLPPLDSDLAVILYTCRHSNPRFRPPLLRLQKRLLELPDLKRESSKTSIIVRRSRKLLEACKHRVLRTFRGKREGKKQTASIGTWGTSDDSVSSNYNI